MFVYRREGASVSDGVVGALLALEPFHLFGTYARDASKGLSVSLTALAVYIGPPYRAAL